MTPLQQFTESLEGQNILIVGDVMVDAYMWGNVNRISPEAPVPIVEIQRRERRLGGAANVAVNIQSMGGNPVMCSVLGNDDESKEFLQIMYDHNMDKRGITTSDNRITTVKTRIIGNGTHMLRIDEEMTAPLAATDEQMMTDRLDKIFKTMNISAVILQDYDKGNLTPAVIDHVVELARRKKIITTVDPKHRNFANFHDVTLFKPNLKELKEGLNIEIDESSAETMKRDLDEAALLLHQRQHIDVVLITLSAKGVYVCDFRQEEPYSLIIPAHLRSICDVSGAGDTVISVITMALAAGLDVETAVRYANMAGGIVCEEVGVVPVNRERLLSELASLQ
ncbi:MAG: bifunctional ADP-heptose synthase [Bacteroidales bacterium]|nr:bifunctional ADP-heptose synthase [Bacteroidales bacterium]